MKITLAVIIAFISLTTTKLRAEVRPVFDLLFNKQWALKNNGQVILKNISDLERIKVEGLSGNDIKWVDTNEIPTTKKELIVAVIDSGMDIEHPDLVGRTWFNERLCTNAPNAKILACNGFNFLDGNNNVSDDVGHGTHVAGIIAANKNSIGIVGAADARIKIMPLKVINSEVSGFVYNGKLITDVVADAMIFAIANGAEVINLSLGWPKLIDTPKVRQAFQMAENKNIMVIAASGNNNKDLPTFPCAYENVVCVGASDNRGELADFTNHGSKVDLVAPGEYIISTIPKKLESRVLRIANYEVKRGSSQAAPFVTAAVASLKLLNPGLTNDQVRMLLFRSAKQLEKSKNNHFVKFGSLDMKKILNSASVPEESPFLNPQIKTVTEVKYQMSDKRFNFSIPLKNISNLDYTGSVCINSSSEAIKIDQNCFEVKDLKGHTMTTLSISGSLIDLSLDSHIMFTIKIDRNIFETSLVFSRDLNDDKDLKTEIINGGSFDDMGIISGDRRISRMTRVMDKHHLLSFPEYFYIEKSKQTATSTVISFLTNENGAYVVKNISLPLVNRVLSIHRQDINGDGAVDLFIYALSAKKDELLFFNFAKDLNPLFGKYSKWTMTLSTFEGLPIDGGSEKFEWFKIKHPQLGAIVVPSIYKSYTMPEADNSKNVLDRVIGAGRHQFYLSPKLESAGDLMKIELRVIDSVAATKKMRTDFHFYEDQTLSLLKTFPQTAAQAKKGEIHALAVLDDDNQKIYLELILTSEGIQTKPLTNMIGLETALIYPVINSNDGQITNESILTSLLNRSGAEFLVKSEKSVSAPLVLRQDWENPIIGLIGSFDMSGEKNYLIENRSTVTFLSAKGDRFDLPVYRDSSFPGQNFSETLMPVLSDGRSGVFVNSTLIYGERLYSMIGTDSSFTRPVHLSIAIPTGCVPLNPEILGENSNHNYAFLCRGSDKQTSLKFLPMSKH